MRSRTLNLTLAVLALLVSAATSAKADNITFAGNFAQDNAVRLFSFTVTTPSNVRLFTTSFAGGVNLDGTTTPPGGFAPILTLFDAGGNFITENPDFDIDPAQVSDAAIERLLSPGTYLLSVTQFENFVETTSLAGGFIYDDEPNFTRRVFGNGSGSFIAPDGSQRTSNFTVNFQNVASAQPAAAPVPEPATLALLGTGLAGVVAGVRRRRGAGKNRDAETD